MNTDISESLVIIRKLLLGIHPRKGSQLPAKSVCKQPDTVRALSVAVDALKQFKRFDEWQESSPPRASKPWSVNEEKYLVKIFRSGESINMLAELHQRTEGSIRSRLIRLGLLDY